MCANLLHKSSRGFREMFTIKQLTSAKPISSIHFFNPREVSLLGHKQPHLSSYLNHRIAHKTPIRVSMCKHG